MVMAITVQSPLGRDFTGKKTTQLLKWEHFFLSTERIKLNFIYVSKTFYLIEMLYRTNFFIKFLLPVENSSNFYQV